MEVKLKIKYKDRYFSILNYHSKELIVEDTGSLSYKSMKDYIEVTKDNIKNYINK